MAGNAKNPGSTVSPALCYRDAPAAPVRARIRTGHLWNFVEFRHLRAMDRKPSLMSVPAQAQRRWAA
jgi:hypothetical protein